VFLALHPLSEARWAAEVDGVAPEARPAAFVQLLKGTSARKGDFAQQLAERIVAGSSFTVPVYLRDAILAVAG
jgi:putative ATP-dependent endonuclease of OLD family